MDQRLQDTPSDRQTYLLLEAVKNQISVGPGYLLGSLSEGSLIIVKAQATNTTDMYS